MSDALPQDAAPVDMPRATRVQDFINRLNAHEARGEQLDAERIELDLSPHAIKKIRAHQKTLAALMAGDLLPKAAQQ